MASLYNGNVMKSIVTISSACALAFAGMASAQDAPAPAPAAETPAAPVAPAAEVSKEAKEAADQMLALMKEIVRHAQHGEGQGHCRRGCGKDGKNQ